jgi:hypothetical protein
MGCVCTASRTPSSPLHSCTLLTHSRGTAAYAARRRSEQSPALVSLLRVHAARHPAGRLTLPELERLLQMTFADRVLATELARAKPTEEEQCVLSATTAPAPRLPHHGSHTTAPTPRLTHHGSRPMAHIQHTAHTVHTYSHFTRTYRCTSAYHYISEEQQ